MKDTGRVSKKMTEEEGGGLRNEEWAYKRVNIMSGRQVTHKGRRDRKGENTEERLSKGRRSTQK